jgi:hypothetical protein
MIINSTLYPILGGNIALITVTSCKIGNPIETPVSVKPFGDTLMIRRTRDRTWWKNLCGGQTARLRLYGRQFPVSSEVIEATPAVATGLKEYFSQNPGYARSLHQP